MKIPNCWCFVVGCAFALGSCASEPPPAPDYHVRFVAPKGGAVLNGLADVRLDISIPEPSRTFELGIDGQPATALPLLTDTLRLDTRQFHNGKQKLRVTITGESGQRWSDAIDVEIRNPDFDLISYSLNDSSFYKGSTVALRLKYPLAGLRLGADFTAADDRFDRAGVTTRDLGDGNYELSYTLSREDSVAPSRYEVTVEATNAAGETAVTRIPLRINSGPRLPITVENALFIEGDVPPVSVSSQPAPVITRVSGANQLTSGVPETLDVQWTRPEGHSAYRVFIRAEGHSGFYVLPLRGEVSQATIPVNLQFAQGTSEPSHGTLDLAVAVADSIGAVQTWTPYRVLYQLLSPFAAHATLSWNGAADLDLKVTTPSGATISYAQRKADGGELELDANGMCSRSDIAAERIFWAPGNVMPGRYVISAEIYDACGSSGADYTAVLFFCGKTHTVTGRFSAADVTAEGRKKALATIDVDCVNYLHGVVSFEQLYNHVLRTTTDRAAFVPVRAIGTLGGASNVLAETTTDGNGRYELSLPSGTGTDYYLEIESSFTPAGESVPFARVIPNASNSPYLFKVPGIDSKEKLDNEQNVTITVADSSGALNALMRIEQAYNWTIGSFSEADARKVTPVVARWSRGEDSPMPPVPPGVAQPKPPFRSYYLEDVIYLGGLAEDINEHDDPVIVHEYFHHVWSHLGLTRVGGPHDSNGRAMPVLALSEGTATVLGQQSLGHPFYWDTFGSAIMVTDLEDRTRPDEFVQGADLGTADNTMRGNVSETLVAAVLWDLLDPSGGAQEPTDQIDSTKQVTLGALAHYLTAAARRDRGAPGADLVDLLDGWRCGYGTLAASEKLKALLDERRFNYDFALVACP